MSRTGRNGAAPAVESTGAALPMPPPVPDPEVAPRWSEHEGIPVSLAGLVVPIDDLRPYHRNPRRGKVDVIVESLQTHGQYRPVVVNRGNLTGRPNEVLAGNHTLQGAVVLGWSYLAATFVDVDDDGAARIVAVDNRASDVAGYDEDVLAGLLSELDGLQGTGFTQKDLDALLSIPDDTAGIGSTPSLADRFGVPPFTTLNGRDGVWRARVAQWDRLGIRSQLGRSAGLIYTSPQMLWKNWYVVKAGFEADAGRKLTTDEVLDLGRSTLTPFNTDAGTSTFDPVLAELMLRWFSSEGMRVVDPWAGGSVRGVVSAALGRRYLGVELRPEQVDESRFQVDQITPRIESVPAVPPSIGDPDALTPVVLDVEREVWVKRDDAFEVGGARGGKARVVLALARDAQAEGARTLVVAGSRRSPLVLVVAAVAASLGLAAECHVPAGEATPELRAAESLGALLVRHSTDSITALVHAADVAAGRGGCYRVPSGLENALTVALTAEQAANIPEECRRIVVPVGSGMSLAGILQGLDDAGRGDLPVLGVVVGADPRAVLDDFAPPGWDERVELVGSPLDYHDEAPHQWLGAIRLDPNYEAKCLPFLRAGDCLWVVGRRETGGGDRGPVIVPEYLVGDSRVALAAMPAGSADMVIGCPPYYDLEKYCEDPRDLSNMTRAEFDTEMAATLVEVGRVMRDDSFAVFVVGSVRDKRGLLLDMKSLMVSAGEAAGLRLYNDAILLTMIGTVPVRAGRSFAATRTLGRTHQEVLVFVKGDRRRAARACGDVEASIAVVPAAEEDGSP